MVYRDYGCYNIDIYLRGNREIKRIKESKGGMENGKS